MKAVTKLALTIASMFCVGRAIGTDSVDWLAIAVIALWLRVLMSDGKGKDAR